MIKLYREEASAEADTIEAEFREMVLGYDKVVVDAFQVRLSRILVMNSVRPSASCSMTRNSAPLASSKALSFSWMGVVMGEL